MLNFAASYVRPMGLNPKAVYECVACNNRFTTETGCAFPATRQDGEVHIFFFCSTLCFLNAMPLEACGRA
jgi:hypothetical protein